MEATELSMGALVFIPLLALIWILGLALIVVASHYFLVVVDSTAAGSDKIVWPSDPFTDWVWKGFYLVWIGGALTGPFVILGRLTSHDPWVRFAITAGSFWLLFPIGMLSSLSANSRWVPFSPRLFGRLSQRAGTVLGFYLLSIPIALGFVGALHAIVIRTGLSTMLVVVLAPLAAAGLLIYARALGRLGLVLTFTTGGENEQVKRKRKRKKEIEEPDKHDEQPIYKQPSELPPIDTPFEGPVTGYNVQFDNKAPLPEEAPTPRSRIDDDAEDLTPFTVEAEHPDPEVAKKPPERPPPRQDELDFWDKSKRVKEPKHPWDATLATFLGEPRTATAWLIVTAGLALFGLMLELLRELRPA